MPEQIHGHEVMHMMMEEGRVYTKAVLRAVTVERFGAEARFFTCSVANMKTEELMGFLECRGKFIDEGEWFGTELDRICQH